MKLKKYTAANISLQKQNIAVASVAVPFFTVLYVLYSALCMHLVQFITAEDNSNVNVDVGYVLLMT